MRPFSISITKVIYHVSVSICNNYLHVLLKYYLGKPRALSSTAQVFRAGDIQVYSDATGAALLIGRVSLAHYHQLNGPGQVNLVNM